MTGTAFSAFVTNAQASLASMFPCELVVGGVTASNAVRSAWRKGAQLAEFGGGAYPYEVCTVRVLRADVVGATILPNATTATVDGVSVKIMAVRDLKNDPALHIECAATDP